LRVPEINTPANLNQVLAGWDPARLLVFCDEGAEMAAPADVLAALKPGSLGVLVGPEGGFDPDEQDKLRARPFVVPISLGPRILRADTAAVAVLALVNAVLGDWRSR
jgi:16S rRNA (uracil1498-N3)-methyltransferase